MKNCFPALGGVQALSFSAVLGGVAALLINSPVLGWCTGLPGSIASAMPPYGLRHPLYPSGDNGCSGVKKHSSRQWLLGRKPHMDSTDSSSYETWQSSLDMFLFTYFSEMICLTRWQYFVTYFYCLLFQGREWTLPDKHWLSCKGKEVSSCHTAHGTD